MMDSLFGDKASIKAPAIATSDGPMPPIEDSLSLIPSSSKVASSVESERCKFKIDDRLLFDYCVTIDITISNVCCRPCKEEASRRYN